MEPAYHRLEFDLRLHLTHLDAGQRQDSTGVLHEI